MGGKVIGVDPGLTTFGFAVLEDGELVDSGEIGIKKEKKLRMHFADDFAHRVLRLSKNIRRLLRCHEPDLLAFEALSLPRSSTSSAKLAAGVAAAISQCVDGARLACWRRPFGGMGWLAGGRRRMETGKLKADS